MAQNNTTQKRRVVLCKEVKLVILSENFLKIANIYLIGLYPTTAKAIPIKKHLKA